MKTKRGFFAAAVAAFSLLDAGGSVAAAGAAGVYKGSYASYADGGDAGDVTIIITDQGGVTCDFQSTRSGYANITTGGSVTATTPFLKASCEEAAPNNGGPWQALSDSSSVAGASIAGTWTSSTVVVGDPGPTGSFETTFVSALYAIDPAAMTGIWQGGPGAFNVLASDAGLVISFEGCTNAASTTADGQPSGPSLGSPLWLLSDVGPTSVIPGAPIDVALYAPTDPSQTNPDPSTVESTGDLEITFIDCHHALAIPNTPTLTGPMNLQLLAGVAGAPGC